MKSAHEKAIDWALARGYVMSVTDLCCDEDEWDLEYSSDRDAIIDACKGTDLPNVYIFRHDLKYLLTFSVIDEGSPDETINDWTIPNDDAAEWRVEAAAAFDKAIQPEPEPDPPLLYTGSVTINFDMQSARKQPRAEWLVNLIAEKVVAHAENDLGLNVFDSFCEAFDVGDS